MSTDKSDLAQRVRKIASSADDLILSAELLADEISDAACELEEAEADCNSDNYEEASAALDAAAAAVGRITDYTDDVVDSLRDALSAIDAVDAKPEAAAEPVSPALTA